MTRTIAALSTFMVLGFSTPAYAVTASDLAAGWIAFFDLTWSLPADSTISEPATTVHVAGTWGTGAPENIFTITGDRFSQGGTNYVHAPPFASGEIFVLAFESLWRCTAIQDYGCRPEDSGRSGFNEAVLVFPGSTPTDIRPGDYSPALSSLCLYALTGCREATLKIGRAHV